MKKLGTFLCFVFMSGILTNTLCANAATFGFANVTHNNPINASTGESQLFVDVTDAGMSEILFTFRNTGQKPSSIREIYFETKSLSSIVSIVDYPDMVDFKQYTSPRRLPGGRTLNPAFETNTDFNIEAKTPPNKRGVNPGEQLGVVFTLGPGKTFYGTLNELNSSAMRIGLHVGGFEFEGSESFVSTPEPATIILLGLSSLVLLRKHPRKKYRSH